jgi:hypothetical protein
MIHAIQKPNPEAQLTSDKIEIVRLRDFIACEQKIAKSQIELFAIRLVRMMRSHGRPNVGLTASQRP